MPSKDAQKKNSKPKKERRSSKAAAAEPAQQTAPRGYWRGPLPLPGRQPVPLADYRKAALENSVVKHRDQARDKYVLARNRRAQLAAQEQLALIAETQQQTLLLPPPPVYSPYVAPTQYVAPPAPYYPPTQYYAPSPYVY